MRTVLLLAFCLPLTAQQAAQPAAQPAAPAAADTKPDAAKADTSSPVPAADSWFSGWVDVGYRGVTSVGGSLDTYRSIVDLGSGPKLLGVDFTFTDPKHRFFDQVNVRASNLGGDPYQSIHVDARKAKLYNFSADYRDIAYFNFLPSYADPLLPSGITLDEQAFDTHRHFANFSLDLLPGNWFVPYLAFDRDSSSGTGTTVFVSNGNEYPVPNHLNDSTNLYRGGVRFELRRFHVTLEQGGTTFKSDQNVYQSPQGTINAGNSSSPIFGQQLDLTDLLANYGISGSSIYSKGLFTANPTPWLDLYGQFLYSQPKSDVNYQEVAGGNLYLQSQILFYSSEQFLLAAASKMPHTTASFGGEIRPVRRVRLVESWMTDRLHNAGSAASTDLLLGAAGLSQSTAALLASSLATNYSQFESDIFFDATSKIMVRGGYRYVWGDANDAVLPAAGLASSDNGKLRRNVGVGAITYRPGHGLSLTAEAEGGSSGGVYFRTSLYNYEKVRAQARYQATPSLSLAADFTLLNNQDPLSGVNYDYLAHQESLSVLYSPAGGKMWDFQGSYTRSDLRSNLTYLTPQNLTQQTDRYRDNSHTGSALFNFHPLQGKRFAPRLTAGGSFFISSGSRPTNFYQPVAKLWVPLAKQVILFTEWQYYGYGEAFYLYEGFRTHIITAGLRFTR